MKRFTLLKTMLVAIFIVATGMISRGQEKSYALVTSDAELIAGEKYLVVGIMDGAYYALGNQKTNNRHAVVVTHGSDNIISVVPAAESSNTTSPYEITLGGSTGSWTLRDAVNNTYLLPRSDGNGLRGNTTETNYWTVSIAGTGVATVRYTDAAFDRNEMRFNHNVQPTGAVPLFACYTPGNTTTGLADVYFYKETTVSTEPRISITYPVNGAIITTTSVNIEFMVNNFQIGGENGKVKYTVDSGTPQYATSSPIALAGLAETEHTVVLELVNNDNSSLDPVKTATVNFTVNTSGPAITSIYDIQYTDDPSGDSPMRNQRVRIRGIVTANFNGSSDGEGYYVQERGEAWYGIYIFDNVNSPTVGNTVEIEGIVDEYYNSTQIKTITYFAVIDRESEVFPPILVATGNAGQEQYESCFIKVTGAECKSNGIEQYGIWRVDDGSGELNCKRMQRTDGFTPVQGTRYTVSGVLEYSRGFNLLYRNPSEDISVGVDKHYADKIKIYPNPAVNNINIDLPDGADNISIVNVIGQTLMEMNNVPASQSINIENLDKGIYFVKIEKGENKAVFKFMKE